MTESLPTPPLVVLFGRPGAGKSALLGALLQAGRMQGEALGAEVVDPDRSLDPLHDRVYKETELPRNQNEVVAHSIRLRPWRTGQKSAREQQPAVLVDCDGTVAAALLNEPATVAAGEAKGELAQALGQADALFLVVSAAADKAELDATFRDFHAFLDAMETRREYRRDVGGLPIFLVLTHCDLLVQPKDTLERWQARIEERKAHVKVRFEDYFESVEQELYLPFGSVDLKVLAMSVRRPKLADMPQPSDEPYGVAELFRQGLDAARGHRARGEGAARRLTWTIRGTAGFAAALLSGLLAVLVWQPPAGDDGLEERVRAFENGEGEAAVRLSRAKLAANARHLAAFRQDPSFDHLPPQLREFIEGRLREIEDYRAYSAKLLSGPAPADARNLGELQRLETYLTSEMALPPEYSWGETEAAVLRDEWLRDIGLIREAERLWDERYRDLIRRATGFELASTFEGNWRPEVSSFLAGAEALPFSLSEPIPGSRAVPGPRGEAVTYAVPFEFDRVYQARRDWEAGRGRLLNLRDLSDALGLTVGPDRKPAVLDVPVPGPEIDSAKLPGTRWLTLRQVYPNSDPAYPGWRLSQFPAPGRNELERRLRRSFERGAAHVQKLIRAEMGNPPEARDNPAGWRAVAKSLNDLPYRDWGLVLTLLARLQDPKTDDPVAALAAFLGRDSFALDLRAFAVSIPDDLRDQRAFPGGPFTVKWTRPGGEARVLSFRQVGESQRERGAWVYRFAVEGDGKLTYLPGDGLTAELPLRSGGQEFKLIWAENRSDTYQFERLERGARLVRPGLPPEPALGVHLKASSNTILPNVPVLLPGVR